MIISGSRIGMESRRLYTSYSMDAVTRERNETNLLGGNFLKALNDVSKVNDPIRTEQRLIEKLRIQTINFIIMLLFGKDCLDNRHGISLADINSGGYSVNKVSEKGSYIHYEKESEETSFNAEGIVKTADGREINFGIEFTMSRSFEQYFENSYEYETLELSLVDPLVINFDGDIADVSDQKFYFDLDSDGELDKVSSLGSGSGFLALDLNNDGEINNGNELFGTKSGDGFKDLAKYDSDGNGWIDEADDVFDKLKVMCLNEDGTQSLYTLKEKNVGAIYLGNTNTNFSLTGRENNISNANIRKTGLFLYETGSVGTVQHVDLAVEFGA